MHCQALLYSSGHLKVYSLPKLAQKIQLFEHFFRFWTPVLYKIYTYTFFTNKNGNKKREKSLDNGQD